MIKSAARNFSKELCFEEAYNNAYKCFQKSLLKGTLEEIFDDNKINDHDEKAPFWILATALKRFHDNMQTLPVAGMLPDMTSTTDLYLDIQKM